MTEQNPDPDLTDDTEGHGRGNPADDAAGLDSMADDTKGHIRTRGIPGDDQDEDDTEGHWRKPR